MKTDSDVIYAYIHTVYGDIIILNRFLCDNESRKGIGRGYEGYVQLDLPPR